MGRDLHYVPGSFYRVDDRTGFPTRAGRTRKEWNGLIVDERFWEPRQPQDLVRGLPDYQAVPEPRPLAPNVFVGPTSVALGAFAPVGSLILTVQTLRGLVVGDAVGVMLDSGVLFNTTLTAFVDGTHVRIQNRLPGAASNGNVLTDYQRQVF